MRIDLQQPVTMEGLRSGAGAFWSWWTGELAEILPPAWQAFASRIFGRPEMHLVGEYWMVTAPGHAPVTIDASLPPQMFRDALSRSLGRSLQEPVRLLLPPREVLRRTVRVPAAAVARLRSVIALQLERLCPFKADDVAYACASGQPGSTDSDVEVEVAIVPIATLKNYERWLADIGLSAASFESADGHFVFPPTFRRWSDDPRTTALGLSSVGLLLCLVAFLVAPALRASELESEAHEITRLRLSAVEAVGAKDTLDQLSAPLGSLAARTSEPKALDVLRAVTAAFPMSVQLHSLTIDGAHVRASGISADARPLLGALRRAPHIVSATLAGPVQGTRSGLDRFTVDLTVRP